MVRTMYTESLSDAQLKSAVYSIVSHLKALKDLFIVNDDDWVSTMNCESVLVYGLKDLIRVKKLTSSSITIQDKDDTVWAEVMVDGIRFQTNMPVKEFKDNCEGMFDE